MPFAVFFLFLRNFPTLVTGIFHLWHTYITYPKTAIMNTPFTLTHVFDAPIEKVWHTLTDTRKMREWYFPALQQFEPVAGFQFLFTDDGSPYQKEWKVTEVIPGIKLAHTWSYKGYPGSSVVTFQLHAAGDKTSLTLTHSGLETFPADPHFARHRFEDGWQRIIATNLRNSLENQ